MSIDTKQALRDSEERNQALAELLPDLVALCHDGKLASINQAGIRTIGAATAADIVGKPVERFLHPNCREEFAQVWARVLRGESSLRISACLQTLDGHAVPVRLHMARVAYDAGHAIQLVARSVAAEEPSWMSEPPECGCSGDGRALMLGLSKASLRESEELFRSVFEHAATGMVIYDMAGKCVRVNRAQEQMLGYGADQLVRMTFPEFTHPSDLVAEADLFNQLVEGTRDQYRIDKRLIKRNGGGLWVHQVVSLVRNAEGLPEYAIAVAEDISERKRAEEARRESQTQYRTLFERMTQGVVYQDADGRVTGANPAAMELLGLRAEELLGKDSFMPSQRAIREDGSPFPNELYPATVALRLGTEVRGVVMGIANGQDGQYRWLSLDAVPQFRSGSSRPYQVFTTFNDITSRKQFEETIARSRDFYLRLFDDFPTPVWRADSAGQCDYLNGAWLDMTGREAQQELGDGWLVGIHPDDVGRVMALWYERIHLRQPFEMQFRIRSANGQYRSIIELGRPYYDLDGNYAGFIGTCYDVTERERTGEIMWLYAQRLKVLNEISRAILSAESPEAIAQVAVRYIYQLIPSGRVSVWLFDQASSKGRVVAVQSATGVDPIIGLPILLNGTWYESMCKGEPVVCEDIQALPSASDCDLLGMLRSEGVRTWVGMPIILHNEVIGALNLTSDQPGGFTREHMLIVREVADQLVLAMEHVRLFEEVVKGRERLRHLANRATSVQEEERQRISRELIDEAGQALTALRISLELIQMDLPAEGQEPLRRSLHDAVSLTDSTMNRIRQLAHDLRPPALDALGLAPTLEDLCKNFGRRTHLVVEFEKSELPPLLDAANICLYRFVQEGLNNVAQHANASRVRITLEAVDSTVCVSVQDDGRGFSPAALAQNETSAVGLLGMRERLELLGGRLVIHSSPGAGTRLAAFVPCDAPSQVLPDEEDK